MAEPIRMIERREETPEERRDRALAKLADQLALEEKAALRALELLALAEEKGLLPMLTALLARGDRVLAHAVDLLARDEYASALQNAIGLAQALGKFDPGALAKLVDGAAAGLADAQKQAEGSAKSLGIFELLGLLKDPDVAYAIRFCVGFLSGLGKSLRQERAPE
ncbi:DUF1641 domain-containing protein [Alicyclobacillus vulcanalis]|uniref:Uncharacterized conserved protein YjgD, DUF1641 family n=1 Tax=Alicyclobacillus vulcanalis TaxID=252246 RepID=A0A1N7M599_9BACL|nr:DUF1641 domain-containing protein [Alicyclobacillus vulcanalis]SIS81213.1 Uncharacterized conserved protein YjgD, DUF1641 family [Alicyclobacillus vulcanalis]